MKYVCELCGKVYNEEKGEPERGIVPGTSFAMLPAQYACPDCGSEKEAFTPAKNSTTMRNPSVGVYAKYTEEPGESQR